MFFLFCFDNIHASFLNIVLPYFHNISSFVPPLLLGYSACTPYDILFVLPYVRLSIFYFFLILLLCSLGSIAFVLLIVPLYGLHTIVFVSSGNSFI